MPNVVVVGCMMTDLIAYTPRLVAKGETLKGSKFTSGFGGKGANQAVQCAKLSSFQADKPEEGKDDVQVYMVGKVGQDSYGNNTLTNFHEQNVNASKVFVCEDASVSSGIAPINVDAKGDNTVIIIPGANDLLTEDEVKSAGPIIEKASLVIAQLELPTNVTMTALKLAKEHGVTTLLNPAPATADLDSSIYEYCDIVAPNETELALLTNTQPPNTVEEATNAAKILMGKGVKMVLVTLGEKGCLLVTPTRTTHVPAHDFGSDFKVVDTVGAGDSFIGSLSYFLARGVDIDEAMKRANMIAGLSVTNHGTQTAFQNRTAINRPDWFQ